MEQIPLDDPRNEKAQGALDAMHEFWKTQPMKGAMQWLESTNGEILIFTRGEYANQIRQAVIDVVASDGFNSTTEVFEVEKEDFPFEEEEEYE